MALKQNPLLINKIVAEKLSDKIQVMMVPTDGKFFFANDVLRSAPQMLQQSEDPLARPVVSSNSKGGTSRIWSTCGRRFSQMRGSAHLQTLSAIFTISVFGDAKDARSLKVSTILRAGGWVIRLEPGAG